ncbi:MAG: hypothetical protein AAFU79_11065 [Myxococcota bacterium]
MTPPFELGVGIRSDLVVAQGRAELREYRGHLRVRTPAEPDYFWGNYLVVPRAPAPEARSALETLFAEAFSDLGDPGHRAYTWPPIGLTDPAWAAVTEKRPNTTLVIVADEEDEDVVRLYERIGFQPIERVGSLCRYDRDVWDSNNDHPSCG